MCKDTSSGIDQSGHVAKRCENLAHAALCSPSLIVQMQGFHFEREASWDEEENKRKKSSQSTSQSWIIPLTLWVYHCSAFPTREKGNNFHLKDSCDMPGRYYQARTQFLERLQMMFGIFIFESKEGLCPNHGNEARMEFIARSRVRPWRGWWLWELLLGGRESVDRRGWHGIRIK